jgi:hypothetical protein
MASIAQNRAVTATTRCGVRCSARDHCSCDSIARRLQAAPSRAASRGDQTPATTIRATARGWSPLTTGSGKGECASSWPGAIYSEIAARQRELGREIREWRLRSQPMSVGALDWYVLGNLRSNRRQARLRHAAARTPLRCGGRDVEDLEVSEEARERAGIIVEDGGLERAGLLSPRRLPRGSRCQGLARDALGLRQTLDTCASAWRALRGQSRPASTLQGVRP